MGGSKVGKTETGLVFSTEERKHGQSTSSQRQGPVTTDPVSLKCRPAPRTSSPNECGMNGWDFTSALLPHYKGAGNDSKRVSKGGGGVVKRPPWEACAEKITGGRTLERTTVVRAQFMDTEGAGAWASNRMNEGRVLWSPARTSDGWVGEGSEGKVS